MSVPSKEKGLYQGGPSGNFLIRCSEDTYEQLVRLREVTYKRYKGDDRTFKGNSKLLNRRSVNEIKELLHLDKQNSKLLVDLVFPAASGSLNSDWWESDVLIVRGMSNRDSTEAYKIALGHLLPGNHLFPIFIIYLKLIHQFSLPFHIFQYVKLYCL